MNVFDFDRFGKHDQIGQVSVPLGKIDLATTLERVDLIESPPVCEVAGFNLVKSFAGKSLR